MSSNIENVYRVATSLKSSRVCVTSHAYYACLSLRFKYIEHSFISTNQSSNILWRGNKIFTSDPAPCRLILSLLHGKQNLWLGTDGHCTKWVSSSRSWQMVHFKVAVAAAAAAAAVGVSPSAEVGIVPATPEASVDVTLVVEETWRDPEERRPLVEEPAATSTNCYDIGIFTQNL